MDDFDHEAPPPHSIPSHLSSTLIPNLPQSAYYIPNFISPAEETLLLNHISNAPLPTWKTLSHRRLQAYPSTLSNSNTLLEAPLPPWLADPIIPRILSLSTESVPSPNNPSLPAEQPVRTQPQNLPNIFTGSPHGRPNHCLVNEYFPGQGIHPHEDGNAYYPVVCTVSLGSHTVLNISPKRSVDEDDDGGGDTAVKNGEGQKWRILQERRSLLISAEKIYTGFLHGIEGVEVDEGLEAGGVVNWDLLGVQGAWEGGRRERGTRVSLTFRDVVKVKRLGKAFGGLRR